MKKEVSPDEVNFVFPKANMENIIEAIKNLGSELNSLANVFEEIEIPTLPKLEINISQNLTNFPVDKFHNYIRPVSRQIRRRRDTMHRVIVEGIIKAKPYDIVEYSHIDMKLNGVFRAQENMFQNIWDQVCEVKVARINGISLENIIEHIELDVFSNGRRMSEFSKGQIWATTLAVFEIVGTFTGKHIDDQVFLKCKHSIHPKFIKDDIYWDYPEHVEKHYRKVVNKDQDAQKIKLR